MPVIVPAVPGIADTRTLEWAEANGARAEWLPPGDDGAYWRLLSAEWAAPGDLLVVEHDMQPAPGVTAAMLACPRPWCSSPYQLVTGYWLTEGLGCTKLAGRLKERHPGLMERLGQMTGDGLPPRDWRRLDVRLARLLVDLGYRPHRHRRSLHLHDYASRP